MSDDLPDPAPDLERVPDEELRDYLGLFSSRGQGRVRSTELHAVKASGDAPIADGMPSGSEGAEPGQVVVDVVDSSHGRWRVRLVGAAITHFYGHRVDEDPEPSHQERLEEALALVGAATWEIHDSAGNLYGRRPLTRGTRLTAAQEHRAALEHLAKDRSGVLHAARSGWLGATSLQVSFADLIVENVTDSYPANSCVACGTAQFTLRTLASIPVTARDDGSFVAQASDLADLAGQVVLRGAFTSVLCSGCGLRVARVEEEHATTVGESVLGNRRSARLTALLPPSP